MTTKVIIKSPKDNHNNILIELVDPISGEIARQRVLTDGEEEAFYLFDSQEILLQEVAKS